MLNTAMPATLRNRPIARRDFLELAWKSMLALSGLLGIGAVARFLDYASEPAPPTEFDLGLATQYPPGSHTLIPDAQAILFATPTGFRALSIVCPHLGCSVEPAADGFVCRCHASRFDLQGGLVHGPATRPLQTLRVEQASNGHLILHNQD